MNRYRRLALGAAAAFVLLLGLSACGDSSRNTTAKSAYIGPSNAVTNLRAHVIAPQGYVKYDLDTDSDDHSPTPSKEDEKEMVLAARHGVDSADRQAVTSVIRAYMKAAASGDGSTGCALLARPLAEGTAAGAPAGVAKACPPALARLFGQQHAHLAAEEVGSMVITGVHVLKDTGFATLGFRKAVEAELLLQREGPTWKINALFDSTLP